MTDIDRASLSLSEGHSNDETLNIKQQDNELSQSTATNIKIVMAASKDDSGDEDEVPLTKINNRASAFITTPVPNLGNKTNARPQSMLPATRVAIENNNPPRPISSINLGVKQSINNVINKEVARNIITKPSANEKETVEESIPYEKNYEDTENEDSSEKGTVNLPVSQKFKNLTIDSDASVKETIEVSRKSQLGSIPNLLVEDENSVVHNVDNNNADKQVDYADEDEKQHNEVSIDSDEGKESSKILQRVASVGQKLDESVPSLSLSVNSLNIDDSSIRRQSLFTNRRSMLGPTASPLVGDEDFDDEENLVTVKKSARLSMLPQNLVHEGLTPSTSSERSLYVSPGNVEQMSADLSSKNVRASFIYKSLSTGRLDYTGSDDDDELPLAHLTTDDEEGSISTDERSINSRISGSPSTFSKSLNQPSSTSRFTPLSALTPLHKELERVHNNEPIKDMTYGQLNVIIESHLYPLLMEIAALKERIAAINAPGNKYGPNNPKLPTLGPGFVKHKQNPTEMLSKRMNSMVEHRTKEAHNSFVRKMNEDAAVQPVIREAPPEIVNEDEVKDNEKKDKKDKKKDKHKSKDISKKDIESVENPIIVDEPNEVEAPTSVVDNVRLSVPA